MGYMRNPRTTQERRANGKRCNLVEIDGYLVKLRPKRSVSNLVEAWDDILRSNYNHRTWKRHRKTKYKN